MILSPMPAPQQPHEEPPSPFEEIRNVKQRAFLSAYAACGHLTRAAQHAHCALASHYVWLKQADYAAAFAVAREMAAGLHEDEATRRALGWEETHYTTKGEPYPVWRYSDTLLVVRLKALRPEKYRDTSHREGRQDISDLLKAVLLELHERRLDPAPIADATWAPLPPAPRAHGHHQALPAPPGVDDDA